MLGDSVDPVVTATEKTQNINPVVTTTRYLFCRHNYTPFSGNSMIVKTYKIRVSAFRPEQANLLKPSIYGRFRPLYLLILDIKATVSTCFVKGNRSTPRVNRRP